MSNDSDEEGETPVGVWASYCCIFPYLSVFIPINWPISYHNLTPLVEAAQWDISLCGSAAKIKGRNWHHFGSPMGDRRR